MKKKQHHPTLKEIQKDVLLKEQSDASSKNQTREEAIHSDKNGKTAERK